MRIFICIKSIYDNDIALKLAKKYSPNIEVIDEQTLVFDLIGKEAEQARQIADKEFDRKEFISLSISDNLAASILLAKNQFGISFANQTDKSSLHKLPIETLEAKKDFLHLMENWAIHSLGDFCQLPEDEMVSRFGKEVIGQMRAANGDSYRNYKWNIEEDHFSWETELKGEIETIEPLNFILSTAVRVIFEKLKQIGLSSQSAEVILFGRDLEKSYQVKIVFPNTKEKIWMKQLISKIELNPPKFCIDKVKLLFTPCKPRTIQSDLYSGVILEPENLDLIVSKLKKIVGVADIGIPSLKNSWKQEFYLKTDISSLLTDSYRELKKTIHSTFYFLPRSVKSKLLFKKGVPISLSMSGNNLSVIKASGPWRKNTDWFNESNWSRDEWDLEIETGEVYRVFRTDSGEVFVEGGYD